MCLHDSKHNFQSQRKPKNILQEKTAAREGKKQRNFVFSTPSFKALTELYCVHFKGLARWWEPKLNEYYNVTR